MVRKWTVVSSLIFMFMAWPAAVQAQAPERTLLHTIIRMDKQGDNVWQATVAVSNVGRSAATPPIIVRLIGETNGGQEEILASFTRPRALPPGRSFTHTFRLGFKQADFLKATAQAKNTPLAISGKVGVPIHLLVLLALVLAMVFLQRRFRRRAEKSLFPGSPAG